MPKSLTYFPLVFCALLFITACRKKDKSPEQTNTPSATGPYSVMQTAYLYADNGGVITLDSSVIAAFSQNTIGAFPPTFIQAGNVSLNDSALYINPEVVYENVNKINIAQTLKWTVSGSGTITAFTHTYVPSYPKYTGGNLLPDTCIKANGITLNISGVSNLQNFISVSLSGTSSAYVSKQLSGNGTVVFTASELSSFTTNAGLTIELVFQNTKTETLGGVLHSFNNNVWYNKVAYLK